MSFLLVFNLGVTLFQTWKHEACQDTSVIASHVYHVICFGCSTSCFSCQSAHGQAVRLSIRQTQSGLFVWHVLVHGVQRCTISDHQQLLHPRRPVSTLVRFVDGAWPNTKVFSSDSKFSLGVEVVGSSSYVSSPICVRILTSTSVAVARSLMSSVH